MRKEGAQGVRPPVGSRGKAPIGGLGELTLFVNECLNVDVLDEKISKTAKYTIIKNYGQLKGGGAGARPP